MISSMYVIRAFEERCVSGAGRQINRVNIEKRGGGCSTHMEHILDLTQVNRVLV